MVWFSLIIVMLTGCHARLEKAVNAPKSILLPQHAMAGYQWHKPLVQEIMVPAQVRLGFYEPEHREMVVIRPGYWEKVDQQMKVNNQEELSNEKITDVDDGVDISVMPSQR